MTNTELKTIRESRNLTKSEFAALLGTTAMVYGRYESGRSTIPEKISKAAEALASLPTVEEKTVTTPVEKKEAASFTVEKKAAVEEKKPSAPKKTRKTSKKSTSATAATPATPATTPSTVDKKEAATPDKKAAPKKAEKKAAPKKKPSTPAKTKLAQKKAPAPKKTTKSPSVVIESLSGNQITIESLLTKVPAEAVSIYVKPGENKAYWVSKTSAGDVELW